MIRALAVPAALALSLAACAGNPPPPPSAAILAPPGEGPAFGTSGNSQGPVTAFTGPSGTTGAAPVTRNTVGATPMDTSNSASARGNPMAFSTPTTMASTGATPMDDSNSASARGGPGTGPVGSLRNSNRGPAVATTVRDTTAAGRPMTPAQRRVAMRQQRTAATGSDAAYMGGGMVMEGPAAPR